MFDGVVMDVIHMAGKVGLVAYPMFPISMLPDGLFAVLPSRCVGCVPECVGAMLGKSGLAQTPAGREVGIVGRQGPDAVEMIGHDDDGVDFRSGMTTMASILNGRDWRTDRKASRRTSTASADARIGRRRFVTRVKKKVPPGTMACR